MNKIQAYWNSLPHYVQAPLMVAGGAAAGVLYHALMAPDACLTLACWKGYLHAAIATGVTAGLSLYVPANVGKK
jgi:hypothetical protein